MSVTAPCTAELMAEEIEPEIPFTALVTAC